MGTWRSSKELETKIENSRVVNDSRFGMEDLVNNPLFVEAYNISKTYLECSQQIHKIYSEQPCSVENAFKFDKKVRNSRSEDLCTSLTKFEAMRTHIPKTNVKSDYENQIASLQENIVSSSVNEVAIIESVDFRKRVSSFKEEHYVRGRRLIRERHRNLSLQKVADKSFIKKTNSAPIPILAPNVKIKAIPSNQANFQPGKTGTFVDDVPCAEDLVVGNICPAAASKKRKYKVKVKILRKKPKQKASPSPPPPPPPPKLPPPPPRKLPPPPPPRKLLPPPPPPPKLLPPPPPPPKLLPLPPPPRLPLPPPPPPPKLPPQPPRKLPPPPPPPPPITRISLSSRPHSRLPPLSYRKSSPPPPQRSPPIAISPSPRSSTLDPHPGKFKCRKVTSLSPYPLEIPTAIPNHQLQQVVQTTHYNLGQLYYAQAIGHDMPYTIQNNCPSFFTAPQTVPFYPNYPPTPNIQMHISQQLPVLPYINQQPGHSKLNEGNFTS